MARIVPRDLELAVAENTAAVQRLDASIRENADVNVEETAYQQALQFVKSTAAAVQAAAERMTAGRAKLDYADRDLARARRLAATGARTQDELEQSVLSQVQSDVDYKQDQLVHAAMVAVGAATDLLPRMVRQYIDRKGLSGNVLRKQKAEAEARLQEVLQEQRRGTMRSPVNGVVLDRLVSNERYLTAGTRSWRSAGWKTWRSRPTCSASTWWGPRWAIAWKSTARPSDSRRPRGSWPASIPPASPRSVPWASSSSGSR